MILLRPTPSVMVPTNALRLGRATGSGPLTPPGGDSRRKSRRTALDCDRRPETPRTGTLHWGTLKLVVLDVRWKSPERQICVAGGGLRGQLVESLRGCRKKLAARVQGPIASPPLWPSPDGAHFVSHRGSERESSHETLGRPPPNDCLEMRMEHECVAR